jgi:hypothetical protein
MKEQSREQRLMEGSAAMEAVLWLRDSREESDETRRRKDAVVVGEGIGGEKR